MAAARLEFLKLLKALPAERLIFLDETGAQTNLTRLWGRAPRGERCLDRAPAGHWATSTLIGAIRSSGPIEPATVVLDGPVNAETFEHYIECCLAPQLAAGEIVIMDNLSSHKVERVRAAIESRGASLLYLPPYSPDFNPIEKLFAKVKSWLRRLRARTFDALVAAFAQALRALSPEECANYFRSCGYAT